MSKPLVNWAAKRRKARHTDPARLAPEVESTPAPPGLVMKNCRSENGGTGLHVGPGASVEIDGFVSEGDKTAIRNHGQIRGRNIDIR